MSERPEGAWWRDPAPWGVAAIAVAIRWIWVAFGMRPPKGLHDPVIYLYSATQIACGRGYVSLSNTGCSTVDPPFRTAYYPPGYPLALGALRKLVELT
ncbi:MAG: hypothetical protein ACKOYM_05250, partial [Actinomycetes bacterium]